MRKALITIVVSLSASPIIGGPVENHDAMLAAAAELEFAQDGNDAAVLAVYTIVRSQLAMFYGYADNLAACWDVARLLNDQFEAANHYCERVEGPTD